MCYINLNFSRRIFLRFRPAQPEFDFGEVRELADRLIQLQNIHKDYGGKTVLKNINLYVRDKEFVTLLGPSGCGKTTTLRIIGGFENPSAGVVYFDGKTLPSCHLTSGR